MLFPRKYASCPWPDSRYREYMNGRLKKIDMSAPDPDKEWEEVVNELDDNVDSEATLN